MTIADEMARDAVAESSVKDISVDEVSAEIDRILANPGSSDCARSKYNKKIGDMFEKCRRGAAPMR